MSGRQEGRTRERRRANHLPAARRRGERLLALLAGGSVALNFPLLSVFGDTTLVLGIPALYLYLFLVWAVIIGSTALVLRGGSPGPPPAGDRRRER